MTMTCTATPNEDVLSTEAAKARVYIRRAAAGLKLVRREEEFAFPEGKEYLREIRIHRLLQGSARKTKRDQPARTD